jgi:hypothetical protein
MDFNDIVSMFNQKHWVAANEVMTWISIEMAGNISRYFKNLRDVKPALLS